MESRIQAEIRKSLEGLESYKNLLAELAVARFEEFEVPDFFIPGWPKNLDVWLPLGKREFLFPINEGGCNFPTYYYLIKEKKQIDFRIMLAGQFAFIIRKFNPYHRRELGKDYAQLERDHCSSSDISLPHLKIEALILLSQFGDEIFTKLTEKVKGLKSAQQEHNRVIGMAKKAVEAIKVWKIA